MEVTSGAAAPTTAVTNTTSVFMVILPTYRREQSVECTPFNLAISTPSNTVLLDWARQERRRPPQSWFDENSDPFTASDE